ncbi:MAG: sulfurtransferase TusA family protein [Thermanaerothrix sp.]|nr:sulfurtransferase TusA family protein [Thermanaerothrix sp.]
MSSSATVDARGLSCPQPVLLTKKALDSSPELPITILVSTVTSRENVMRFCSSRGLSASWEETPDGDFRITAGS